MLRPYLFIGTVALIGSALALSGNNLLVAGLLFLSAAVVFVLTLKRQGKLFSATVLAVVCLLFALRLCSLNMFIENKTQNTNGRTAQVTGRVVRVLSSNNDYSTFTLKIEESSLAAAKGLKVSASIPTAPTFKAGDQIKATLLFSVPEQKFKASNFAGGDYFSCFVQKYYKTGNNSFTVYSFADTVRNAIKSAISKGGSGENSAVLTSLIIGDTSALPNSISDGVKAAGVSHMLVVSGMHVGILCGLSFLLLQRFANRLLFVFIGSGFLLFIATTCLFHVSILRASVAYLVMLLSNIALKNFDSLNSLGIGMLTVLFLFPFSFYNVAFLLSAAATFSVICPATMLINSVSINRKTVPATLFNYVFGVLAVSVSALVCTLPITIYYFGYTAFIAPITNLAVTVVVTAALVLGVLGVLLSFIPFVGSFLCLPVFFFAKGAASVFVFAVEQIGGTKFGVVNINPNENIYCFFITLLFILLVKVFSNHITNRKERAENANRKNLKNCA